VGSSRGTKGDPKLIGDMTEAKVTLNNIELEALLDTGSCVSVISKTCYREMFTNSPIQPLKDTINIECADGGKLPYEGYMELELTLEKRITNINQTSLLIST